MTLATSRFGIFTVLLLLAGCQEFPVSGPQLSDVQAIAARPGTTGVQVIDLSDQIARRLLQARKQSLFSETLGSAVAADFVLGRGDVIEVNIWEAPPATLFGVSAPDQRGAITTSRAVALPEQVIDSAGFISVPFAGRIEAAGHTTEAVAQAIEEKLRGKANHPEIQVRLMKNSSALVTVVGEVTNSVRLPLTSSGERVLDALAAAGGVRQPVSKMTLQLSRGKDSVAMPLDYVIRDPSQNVPLHGGDVLTAIFQPLSFTALGATGKNEEINFEAQGITLAQALARSGGLVDSRSDARGVFIFRYEQAGALDWPTKPVMATNDQLVPVVYRVNLRSADSFFVMQNFAMNDKDVLYVSNAPAAELQKFLNVVFSAAYPVLTVWQLSK